MTASEFDPLHDDSTRLVARLEEAGAPHRYALWPGVTHACIHMTRMLEVAQKHIEDVARWVSSNSAAEQRHIAIELKGQPRRGALARSRLADRPASDRGLEDGS